MKEEYRGIEGEKEAQKKDEIPNFD